MKTPRISPKNIIIILGIAVLFFQAWIVTPYSLNPLRENNLIKRIKKKLHHLSATRPEERIYLQLDKPMYMSGEDVWVAAYVCEGMTLKPSPISDILHVELISPGGNVIKKRSIIMQKGKGKADFSLDNESVGGLYKIRAYTNWMKNEGEDNIFEKEILVQDVILPHLKMKINFEKKSFGPGDEVLAKLELHSNENKPLSNHACTMEVRLAGKKYLEKKILTDEEGSSYIRFHLPSDLSNHDGLLNVVIDYNGNTESISRSIPIILNKINFTVLPEGGDWICGVNNHLAFKVTNEFGKPVEAEGIITDRSGNPVSKFSTYHNGMGSFFLTPKPGEEYYAKITRPEGNSQIFRLPEFLRSGYSMIVKRAENKEVSVLINSTKTDEMSLIASCRGKIYFSTPVHVSP
jgi:hypothetical protein